MVAKIRSGKSIRGILNYNENKVANAEAQLLLACGFSRDADSLSFNNKLDRFEKLTSQNERSRTNALHISLNFSRQDMVDDELMKKIAMDYMDRIGFGNQPFLVYRHFDAAHPHIHIATVTIENGGNRIETFNIGKNQSEKARKEMEIYYGLIKAEDQVKETSYLLKAAKLDKAIYGKSETKSAISGIIRDVISSYKFTSLPELNAVLRQFNILADRGEPGTKMYEKKGLVYCLLDGHGQKGGVPIKASSIYDSPTLKNLEKKFAFNESARKPYGQRLKHQLDKAIATAKDIEELKTMLQKQGIRILLRENVQGNIYGISFIDNATRVVFNGSDLGKAYSAKAFLARLPKDGTMLSKDREQTEVTGIDNGKQGAKETVYPAHNEPVIVTLLDIALSPAHEENQPDPFRRKKKKRLQAE